MNNIKWISVYKNLPKDNVVVLVTDGDKINSAKLRGGHWIMELDVAYRGWILDEDKIIAWMSIYYDAED